MSRLLCRSLVSLALVHAVLVVRGNDTPMVGILALPCSSEPHNCPEEFVADAVSYIPAAYVKWLESAGGRVVPILLNEDTDSVRKLLAQLNGVLFTGGGASFSDDPGNLYWTQLNNVLDYLREFSAGNAHAIPLWATCLGFEALMTATAGTSVLVGGLDAEDLPLPINFTSDGVTSRLFTAGGMPKGYAQDAYSLFASEAISQNAHQAGLTPSAFEGNQNLVQNFTVLGYSYDREGTEFVTLVEDKDGLGLYWYASQFHPEKPMYEFDPSGAANVPHTRDAVFANSYLVEFFMNECRTRNDNVMDEETYMDRVIYNDVPYFLYKEDDEVSYEQVFMWGLRINVPLKWCGIKIM